MIKILGHWEIGYHAPITERFYWSLPVRDFEVDELHMIPKSGVKTCDSKVELIEWDSYEEFFRHHPDLPRVFLEPRTPHSNPDTIWLHDFEHPEDCVYVFGSAHYNPTLNHCREQDSIVTVKTKQDKGVLWADQVMCIVLYDRLTKLWQ